MSKADYIGISEDRLHHSLGVAQKAYGIAKERGKDEEFARKMFLLGWVHDVGYAFSAKASEHADESANMLLSIMPYGAIEDFVHSGTYQAVRRHGRYADMPTEEWIILNQADLQIDSKGYEVDVMNRLYEIEEKYGRYSDEHLTACDVAYRCGLTAENLASIWY